MIDRNRVTERVSFSTLRLELKRAGQPLLIVAIGFVVAIFAGRYILSGISGGIGSTHAMQVEVADATGVVPGRAEVRFYGIQAGTITNDQLVHGHAILTVDVAKKFGPIYKNAQAEVRPNTALQDMYLDITSRGTKNAGVAGPKYVIPLSQTQSPTNLAEVLNVFQPDVRTQLYNILDQLGNGTADRGADLRQAFIELAPFLKLAGTASQQLAVRATLTKHLVHDAGTLSTVLASRSTQLRGLVVNGTRTLNALSTEGGRPLKETLADLPPALKAANTTITNIDEVVPHVNRALTSLEPVANELPTALTNLKELAVKADPAVHRLQTPVVKLVPLVDQLQPLAGQLSQALKLIAPQVPDLNIGITDLNKCTGDIDDFMDWDSSMSKYGDDEGNMTRGNFRVGFVSLPGGNQPNYTSGPTCAGGTPIEAVPVPKYDGPAPAP